MATIRNIANQSLELPSGRLLDPGEEANADVSVEPVASYLADALIKVVDPDAAPGVPGASLVTVRARTEFDAARTPLTIDITDAAEGDAFTVGPNNTLVPLPVGSSADVEALQEAVETKADTLDVVLRERAPINVKDFGAAGDGVTDDTVEVQAAIDACAAQGGGTVVFPAGVYLGDVVTSGGGLSWIWSITTSHVRLEFAEGATLKTTTTARLLFIAGAGRPAGAASWSNYWIGDPSKATYRPMNAAARGDRTVTLATAAHASDFAVGDFIHVRTGQLVDGRLTEPEAEINQVTAANAGSGVLTLRWPLGKPYAQEYFIAGTNGKTSTAVTANAAVFGVAKITDRTIENVAIVGATIDAPNNVASTIDTVGAVVGLTITGLRGTTGGNPVNNIEVRGFRFSDWRVRSKPLAAGGYRWAFAAGTTCSDGKITDVEAVGDGPRALIFHIHEGCADIELSRSKVVSPVGQDDIGPLSIRARAYNVQVRDVEVVSSGTVSPVYVSPECGGGGVLENVRARCADATKGIRVEAPNWTVRAADPATVARMASGARAPAKPFPIEFLVGVVTFDRTTVTLGELPENVIVLGQLLALDVRTVFNGGTSNRITVGWDGGENGILISSSALDVGTTGRKDITTAHYGGFVGIYSGTRRTLKAYYTAGGAPAPTTGVARVLVPFVRVPEAT